MGASGETDNSSKNNKEKNKVAGTVQIPTPDQGEEIRETNAGNRRVNRSHRRTKMLQLHTAHRYFKGDTLEEGSVLGLLSEKLDTGTDFDKFRDKIKGLRREILIMKKM